MKIVEKKVSAGDREIFDLEEFLARPLYAHLAHNSEHGPRESPVWFHWDGIHLWIIGGTSFPENLKRDPRCALGIVDWDPRTGLSQHVGLRGKAAVLPFDSGLARTIFRRYFGPDETDWDRRFDDVFTGELGLEMVRFTPETVVVRDQSYQPTAWASSRERGGPSSPRIREQGPGEDDSRPAAQQVLPTQIGYDRWAEVYDAEDNPLVLLEEERMGPLLGDVAGLAVADIGCGTGRHISRLATAGARITAVDFSEAMLERARAKPGAQAVTFLRHDLAEPLPFSSAAFDRILCCLVVEHIADLDRFFGELRRLCKPDGSVVVSAMHPAMGLRGVQPRFIDLATGSRVCPRSYPHQIADYIMAVSRAALVVDHLSEHAVDASLAARSLRGGKYLGWPLLLLMRLLPAKGRQDSHDSLA
jgi:malonyl-CoA O-methyltransferase